MARAVTVEAAAPETADLSRVLDSALVIVASVMTFFPGVLPSARVVRQEAGMIILFPSYLQHSVLYHGERPRVCVPFNAHMRIVGA